MPSAERWYTWTRQQNKYGKCLHAALGWPVNHVRMHNSSGNNFFPLRRHTTSWRANLDHVVINLWRRYVVGGGGWTKACATGACIACGEGNNQSFSAYFSMPLDSCRLPLQVWVCRRLSHFFSFFFINVRSFVEYDWEDAKLEADIWKWQPQWLLWERKNSPLFVLSLSRTLFGTLLLLKKVDGVRVETLAAPLSLLDLLRR